MPIKPPGYWDDFAVLERELLAFIAERGTPGVMPAYPLLRRAQRSDLAHGIQLHGGMVVVGDRLGLAHRGSRKPLRYWQNPANVDRELLAFVAEHGEPGVMPKKKELAQAGRGDLSLAITRGGGQHAVARRLGLRPADPRSAPGRWRDLAALEAALRAFLAEPGRPQRMPTLKELTAAGRGDLRYAVQRHGGLRAVAARMGLALAASKR